MKHAALRVSREQAEGFLRKSRLGWLRAVLAPGGTSRVSKTELVWMPYYRIPVNVESGKGPGVITVSVEAYSGSFAILEMSGELVESAPAGEAFPPHLSPEEAIKIGREELLRAIMRRRSHHGRPAITGVGEVDVFHYPYWIHYFERRKGLLDFRIMDGVSGERGGARTKTGLLNAFAAGRKAR